MKVSIIKLGSVVEDPVTGFKGTAILYAMGLLGAKQYYIQPKGVDDATGLPFHGVWAGELQVKSANRNLILEEIDLPVDSLGETVKDTLTGYKGTNVSITYHLSGCVHIDIQAKGKLKNGEVIPSLNVDVRRIEGPGIPKLTPPQKKKSIRSHPSPIDAPRPNLR